MVKTREVNTEGIEIKVVAGEGVECLVEVEED